MKKILRDTAMETVAIVISVASLIMASIAALVAACLVFPVWESIVSFMLR